MQIMAAADWGWWLGLLLGAFPLLGLLLCHCNDAFYCAAFALKHRRRLGTRLPPGHMGLPFLGESLSLKRYFRAARRPDGFVDAKKRRYGEGSGVYRTHLFGSPAVLVCSPAANKMVLQSGESFGTWWPAPELVGVSSVANVEGSQHARLRGFVLAAINKPSSLRVIARVIQPRIVAALQSWVDKGAITAAAEIKKMMFDNTCKMFISMEPSPLTNKMEEWFTGLVAGIRALTLDLPGTTFHHARKCRKKLNAVFREELVRRKKAAAARDEAEQDDLMSRLMRVEDEQGRQLCDDEVVDNMVTLVLGGYETTAAAMTWAVYHLAKSPDALAKLREENAAIRRERSGEEVLQNDDIPKLKYTAKVVEETLRLANISAMVFRVARRDVQFGGYTIPEGWKVVVWLRSLHTDAQHYHHPLAFNPDRWDKPARPGTFQVFGGGHRICAGNMLARLQLTVMLHHLSIGYRWELLNPDADIVYHPIPRPSDGAAISFTRL